MTPERKPIAVLYLPRADYFGESLYPVELMAAFNGHHNNIKMPDAFDGYLWFVFVNEALDVPELKVFHEKDYSEAQYDELNTMIQEGINSLKINE